MPCRRTPGFRPSTPANPVLLLQDLAVSLPSQDGAKGGEEFWMSSPQPMSSHPQEPPLPAYPCSRAEQGRVPAGLCSPGWPCPGPSCLGCSACVDRSGGPWSLHVHGFLSIPHGAAGAVLAPCFSSMWCGAAVDPVVALMSPEVLDRSGPGPGSPVPYPCLCHCWDGRRDPVGWGMQCRAHTPGQSQAADSASLCAGLLGRAASSGIRGAAEQEGAEVCTRVGARAVSSSRRER